MQSLTLSLLLLLILGVVVVVSSSEFNTYFYNDLNMINTINNNPRSSWKAKYYPQFEGKKIQQVTRGNLLNSPIATTIPRGKSVSMRSVPMEFDATEQWPDCVTIGEIRDEGDCGASLAFSGVEILEDRLCIATGGQFNVDLSPKYVLTCDTKDFGCSGGFLEPLWDFIKAKGTVKESCVPFNLTTFYCPSRCDDGSELEFYNARDYKIYNASGNNIALQEDLMKNGPVQAVYKIYTDLLNYHSGVYIQTSGTFAGYSVTKITGWGVDSETGLPYWILGMYIIINLLY
jgi:cathepsin B